MKLRVRRPRASKSVANVARALRSIATGAVLGDTAGEMAPRIEKAMKASLRPHRDTGAAEDRATARASGATITLTNAGYGKYIKGYAFARRFPRDWVQRLKAAIGRNARAALRGLT